MPPAALADRRALMSNHPRRPIREGLAMHADLILTNAKITTMAGAGLAEATGLACRDGRFVAVGNEADAMAHAGPETRIIDAGGRRVIPGIVDSHCHPDAYAARLMRWHELSPDHVGSRDALLSRIETECAGLGLDDWFVGYRLNENKSGGYPTLAELDKVSGGRPLFILRTDGHLGLANSRAFEICGIGPDAADPPFGQFDRHPETGGFTGLVRETAAHIFLDRVHDGDTPASIAEGLERVFADWNSLGITTVYNSLTPARAIRAYQMMKDEGRLTMRVGIIVSGREAGLVESYVDAGIQSGFGDDAVRIIGVEWCPDCSTSGRTAAYHTPYIGTPVAGEPVPNTGVLLYELEDLKARAIAAHEAGLQVMIEGVGDRGIDFALDAIEACLAAAPRADHRMRVEHCCHVTPAILTRLKQLAVIDSSATGFMFELGDAYRANRGAGAMVDMWPHRSLIDAGVPAPGHSDAMICKANPFTALDAMVNRETDTAGDLDKRQAVTPGEALRAYTWLGAFAGREEHLKGSIEVGKLADLAVLDRDLLEIDPVGIKDIQVDMTVLGGAVVFER
jgi:predicted amidohydrolase YtcJ